MKAAMFENLLTEKDKKLLEEMDMDLDCLVNFSEAEWHLMKKIKPYTCMGDVWELKSLKRRLLSQVIDDPERLEELTSGETVETKIMNERFCEGISADALIARGGKKESSQDWK